MGRCLLVGGRRSVELTWGDIVITRIASLFSLRANIVRPTTNHLPLSPPPTVKRRPSKTLKQNLFKKKSQKRVITQETKTERERKTKQKRVLVAIALKPSLPATTTIIMMDDISDSDSDDEPPMLVDMSIASEDPDLIAEAPLPTTETTTTTTTATIATNHPQPLQVLPPCPVTILSGFLGSGKTTLIQHILKDPNHGKRIAVIENEFGDGLDIESLIAKDGMEDNDGGKNNALQDLIELPNGCLCCTVKDTLVVTLENLVTQKRQDLDYILIEASGMANPGPIASVFWLDDAMESRLQLDGIVTVVDSHHILEQLKETEEAAQQIAYADRLLLNKIDLLSSSSEQQKQQALQDVKDAMRRLHPTAEIQTTTYSRIPDLDWILNANCFGGSERVEELDRVWNQAVRQQSLQSSLFSQNHNSGSDEAIFCGNDGSQFIPMPTLTSTHVVDNRDRAKIS